MLTLYAGVKKRIQVVLRRMRRTLVAGGAGNARQQIRSSRLAGKLLRNSYMLLFGEMPPL